MPPEGLWTLVVWGPWERWVCAVRTALATTGTWVVRGRVWGASRGHGSPRGAGSWLPLAHLQEASEGDRLRPTEPGSGAARGWDGEDPGGHYWGWEQQFQRVHHLLRALRQVQGNMLPTGQQRVRKKDAFTAYHWEPCIPGCLLSTLMSC